MAMQRSRLRNKDDFPAGLDERLRIQASAVLGDLRSLRDEVSVLVKTAEGHRWRRFLVGGFIATFIPAVRAIFRRPASSSKDRGTDPALGMAANDTEYAFRRSKSLISRILGSVHRPGLATLAFFVFAVLYVFQNEVTLRVARTIGRRLKKLSAKVERGDEEVSEEDVKLLQNWRWRILMWS
ncbi:hypothetical protein QBC47DRAFT_371260 [Echria macrotheca]|uniref:Uncharacterized protein n=1 Tax=Echria macrotheca TaxID=438768 RepID=A0AAJ0BJ75_9PEZI|nr:hypothetical protein QBC47DRAFT_371260 [Echria macrotheca]